MSKIPQTSWKINVNFKFKQTSINEPNFVEKPFFFDLHKIMTIKLET